MRIRVLLPVDKPLIRWLKVKDAKSGDTLRLHVKYERIPKFCRYCGHVGHVEKDCLLPEKEQKVRFGLHLRASPEKKFVVLAPERQEGLAKRNLNFDGKDDDKRQGDAHGKGKAMDKEREQHDVSKPAGSKPAAPDANKGGGPAGTEAANDIARKVLALGFHDSPSVTPPLVFKSLQVHEGGGNGEEVGDNGLDSQTPVKSVLHTRVPEVAQGVAREWEDRMAEAKRPKGQGSIMSSHCSSSENFQLPAGAIAGADVGLDTGIQLQKRFVRCELSSQLCRQVRPSGLSQFVGAITSILSCGKLCNTMQEF